MQSLNPVRRSPTTRTMRKMGDLEVQKKVWGRDGHGIAGANPNYSGRVRVLAAAGVLILAGGAFALITGGHSQSQTATRYVTDVAKGDSLQSNIDQSLRDSPAKSLAIVHDLIQALRVEDQRLSTQHWPGDIKTNLEFLIHDNQPQISDLKKYASASSSKRIVLLKQQYEDAYQSEYVDAQIRGALDATPTVT
jgi:hypothetical protein